MHVGLAGQLDRALATRDQPSATLANPAVVYLVSREGLSSVFDAQVLQPLAKQARDVQVDVVVCEPIGLFVRPAARYERRQRAERARSLGVRLVSLPSPPSRADSLWRDDYVVRRWLSRRFNHNVPFVIHARGSRATDVALAMRGRFPHARVLFDCRGAELAELQAALSEGQPDSKDLLERAAVRERAAATRADHVMCVSAALADYLDHKYRLPPGKITVVPCCVDTAVFVSAGDRREEVRQQLGISDRFVVTYSGSLQWYQRPDRVIRIFQIIKSLYPSAHLLALTPGAEAMQQLCVTAGIARVDFTSMSAPPSDVPRYLAAGDVGVLPRDENLVNRVASPVKFAEYLASGTPVIVTGYVGDYSSLVERERLGVLIPDDGESSQQFVAAMRSFIGAYLADTLQWRQRCQAVATTKLDWNVHLPSVRSTYARLVSSSQEKWPQM